MKTIVQKASRQVIENKLLTALNDSEVVAILATQEDLDIMIEALRKYKHLAVYRSPEKANKARRMAKDFLELKRAAFTEQSRAE